MVNRVPTISLIKCHLKKYIQIVDFLNTNYISLSLHPTFSAAKEKRGPQDSQEVVPVLVGAHAHGQAHDDGGQPVAAGVVEPHLAVVHVAHLRQHAVQVNALDQQPGEHAQPEVVEADGYHFARKL